ncbi:hypothetical protein N658DRAFT_11470 [Parathielavia hyrcaniae]|uniref:AA1-like domain-containing protein n=1 Tax=Parathielavia hyrcaniae TaxID=113614 RepID=A0AAN6QAZ3_9PEZI|nr:hypothetical protein N658DRAFT_11470 [Parathielavia hyrcaniae]
MRSLTCLSSIITLVALPLVVPFPNHSKRFSDISSQLANRAYSKQVSQFNFEPYNITDLNIFCDRPGPTFDYSCNLTFNWFDPNSVRQNRVTSGACHTSWSWDGATKHNATRDGSNPVAEYRGCWTGDTETFFRAAVPAFWHPGNFALELAHHYKDDENFTMPWDHPTTFAEAKIDIYPEGPLGDSVCHYEPGPINGTVVGVVV